MFRRPASEGEGQLKLYGKKKLGWVTVALQTIKKNKNGKKKSRTPPSNFFSAIKLSSTFFFKCYMIKLSIMLASF